VPPVLATSLYGHAKTVSANQFQINFVIYNEIMGKVN